MFSYDLSSSTFTTLVDFTGFTGNYLGQTPISLTLLNNVLYGTTETGGISDLGTMFSYDLSSSTFTTLVDFTGFTGNYLGQNPNSLTLMNGVLYGSTQGSNGGKEDEPQPGTLFKYEVSSSTFTTLVNFNTVNPQTNSLILFNNVLYGVTKYSGPSDGGTLFSYDFTTVTTLFNFSPGSDLGNKPNSLILYDGSLYGTTSSLDNRAIFKYSLSNSVTCFKEDTKILTKEGYKSVQSLKQGDLVKTLLHDFLPIHMIGKQSITHSAFPDRIKNQLYLGPDDLVVTGCHSILVDYYVTKEQCDRSRDVNKGIFLTDKKYRLPACVDERFEVYNVPGTYMVYHLALENDNMFTNYGIYANGLLVESCSKNYLHNRSNMILL